MAQPRSLADQVALGKRRVLSELRKRSVPLSHRGASSLAQMCAVRVYHGENAEVV